MASNGEAGVGANSALTFIALKKDGQLEAFIANDDKGGFKKTSIDGGFANVKALCRSDVIIGDKLRVLDQDGSLTSYLVDIKDDKLGLNKQQEAKPKADKNKTSCFLNIEGADSHYRIQENKLINTGGENQASYSISLVDGLGIKGMSKVKSLAITNANLGTVYSNGAIIVVGEDGKHIGFIALDYANKHKPYTALPKQTP